ncbi:MAG: glycosyltransferase family 39 protein [Pseudomonadota bacterium]
MTRVSTRCAVPLAVFLLTFLFFAFLNERAAWVWDDYAQVVHNPHLSSPGSVPGFFTGSFQKSIASTTFGADIYRPFCLLSLYLDYQFFGARAWGFHLHNDLLHALNVLLLYLLAVRFLPTWAAVFASALFAVHPIGVEAITWISARPDLLVMLYTLLHLYAAVRLFESARTTPSKLWWLLYGISIPLGLYSKETFVTIPLFTLLAIGLTARGETTVRRRLWVCATIAVVVLLPGLAWRHHIVGHTVPPFDPVIFKNALTLSRRFLELLIFPDRSSFLRMYEHVRFVVSRDLFPLLLHALGWLLAIVATWRQRPALLATNLILGSLLPVVLILDMSTFIGERYFYIPLGGLSLWISAVAASLLSTSRIPLSTFTRRFLKGGLVVWIILLAIQTGVRSGEWRTEERLYRSVVERDPSNYWAYYQLSVDSHRQGDLDGQIRYLRAALETRPDDLRILNNLAVYQIQRKHFTEAKQLLDRSLRAAPTRAKTAFNYGYYFESKGDFRQALAWYRRALELDPQYRKAAETLARLKVTP